MLVFKVVLSDGRPAVRRQVIVLAPGERGYGITDHEGSVRIPFMNRFGKVIVGGQTRHLGDLLQIDTIRI